MPQEIYESRGGNEAFYYYDHYTTKASISLEPIQGNDWPTVPERLPGDTRDPKHPALPNSDPFSPYVSATTIVCVCVCVHSLPVPCSLDAFTLRKYDSKPGQTKSYDFVVEILKKDIPACLSKVDTVLTNRCTRGGTTPLWHHIPVAPHHIHLYITAPHHMHPY